MERLLDKIDGPRDLKKFSHEELYQLAGEVSQEIMRVVTLNGGHLGSNLGVIELTIALHYVFDFADDRLLMDVSHQCYTHKLLTGRRKDFPKLRQRGGISGFCNKFESPFDPFTIGHAGTAISTALGLKCGDEVLGTKRHVVAVVGDGSMTCGMSFEALNNAGAMHKNLIIVLNDNTMSISHTVGALADYLSRARMMPLYDDIKTEVRDILEHVPIVGHPVEKALEHLRKSLRASIGGYLFEALGFVYYGPVDGHNITALVDVLKGARRLKRPAVVHVLTTKGRGHDAALEDPFRMHGVAPEPKPVDKPVELNDKVIKAVKRSGKTTYTDVFGGAIVELAKRDRSVVAVTAAMPDGTGLVRFQDQFPDRFFDVGICEQHAVGMAAGMAAAGLKPVVAIYSTFLQRAIDQVFEEVCLQNLHVVFAVDRAGIVGSDGATHNGVFDIGYLRQFPSMVLMAPRDASELEAMLAFAVDLDCPVGIRYPRCAIYDEDLGPKPTPLKMGQAEILMDGDAGAILAYGHMAYQALSAARKLRDEQGVEVMVVNARFAKPLDRKLILNLLKDQPFVLTAEEHSVVGGFGSAVLELACESRPGAGRISRIGLPDSFIEHGSRDEILRGCGLDVAGIHGALLGLTGKVAKDVMSPKWFSGA
jgi:1-deoxy-D-xylulose-5-phosphate synthase